MHNKMLESLAVQSILPINIQFSGFYEVRSEPQRTTSEEKNEQGCGGGNVKAIGS